MSDCSCTAFDSDHPHEDCEIFRRLLVSCSHCGLELRGSCYEFMGAHLHPVCVGPYIHAHPVEVP